MAKTSGIIEPIIDPDTGELIPNKFDAGDNGGDDDINGDYRESGIDGDAEPDKRRKRGRPSGGNRAGNSTGSGSRKNSALAIKGLAGQIEGLHKAAAILIAGINPKLAILLNGVDSKQSEALAIGISDVAQHYDLSIDPKVAAWLKLAMTAGAVYGPMIYAYKTME